MAATELGKSFELNPTMSNMLPPHPRFSHMHPKSIPLMLRPDDFELWLDPGFHQVEAFQNLLRTHIPAPLVCEPVQSPTNLGVVGEPEELAADEVVLKA